MMMSGNRRKASSTERNTDMAKAASKVKEPDVEPDAKDETGEQTAEVNGEDGTEKRTRRPGPTYKLEPLGDSLPENAKTERTSRQVYVDLLAPIVEDEDLWGTWVKVAEFATTSGAKDAAKAIKNGDRDVPEGEWEFEYRRLNREDGTRYSILAARYLGN